MLQLVRLNQFSQLKFVFLIFNFRTQAPPTYNNSKRKKKTMELRRSRSRNRGRTRLFSNTVIQATAVCDGRKELRPRLFILNIDSLFKKLSG